MAPQTWRKAPPENIAAFDAALPKHPLVERRTMFSYPCAFVNGNMFCGLHEDNICVRVGQVSAAARIRAGEGEHFAPMAGRVMKEYIAVPKTDCSDVVRLRKWLDEGLRHALTLAPKARKGKSSAIVRAKTGTKGHKA